ncbi:MAG: Fur family transcriptional regulator [Aerococcus sp.]|nr:Fur family transcriptional regulator [Aerococcus sp.]
MSDFVETFMAQLSDDGYKYTQRRADILAIFDHDEERYFSAKEVQNEIKTTYPKMSFDTIYRNLKLFVDKHFLEEGEVNGEMVFRKHCDPKMGHHHHFICTDCGQAKPIRMCPMEFYQRQLPGYEINDHQFQLFGLCPSCQTKRQVAEA